MPIDRTVGGDIIGFLILLQSESLEAYRQSSRNVFGHSYLSTLVRDKNGRAVI